MNAVTIKDFSEAELEALAWLKRDPSILVSRIHTSNINEMGIIIPGIRVFKKLEDKGYCFQTEEEPCEDGFVFTETIDLTDLGAEIIKSLKI